MFISMLFLMILYEGYFIETKIKYVIFMALVARILSNCFGLLIAMGYNKQILVWLKTALFDSTYQTYVNLPINVVAAKLIPINVEASMFAILSGIWSFSNFFYGRII